MEALQEAVKVIQAVGVVGMGALFVWALYTRKLVWGRDHREEVDELKAMIKEYKTIVDGNNAESLDKLKRFEQRDWDRRVG